MHRRSCTGPHAPAAAACRRPPCPLASRLLPRAPCAPRAQLLPSGCSLSLQRGVGVAFGPDVAKAWLEANGLQMVVRSHEVKDGGYEVAHDGYTITIFSAPNYCDQMGNKGAYIRFDADCTPSFTQFDAAPHPDKRPMAYAAGAWASML